jgi:prevent-host-death family protein
MRRTSVRELHIHTSELIREVAEGGVIVIERRGVPVAELRPVQQSQISSVKKASIFDSMQELWAKLPQSRDSTEAIEEDRDR